MGNRVQPDLKTQRAIEIRDRSTGVAREKRPGGPPLPPCPQTARGKFALSIRRAASKRPDFRPCSPVPHPPQRKARASRFWALRSRLGAGGARRGPSRDAPPASHSKVSRTLPFMGTRVLQSDPASNPIKNCDSKKPVQEGHFGLVFFGAGHVAEIQRGPQPRGVKGRNLEICSKREGSPL